MLLLSLYKRADPPVRPRCSQQQKFLQPFRAKLKSEILHSCKNMYISLP